MEINGGQKLVTNILPTIFFCVQQKKETFWVNYHFASAFFPVGYTFKNVKWI